MKSFNKMMSVFTAFAFLATMPGVGTNSAFAQTVTGVNTGVRSVTPGGFSGAVGVQAGGNNGQVQLQGASMRGTVVGVKVGATVNQRVSVQAAAVDNGTRVSALAAPAPAPAIVTVGQVPAKASEQVMAGPSKTGPPSIIKEVKAQAQNGGAAMSAPNVSVEQASYQGKVQFDMAAKKAALEGANPVSVSGQSAVKAGSVLARPAMAAPSENSTPVPPASESAKPQMGSKLSTFVDALIVTAVGTYTHSVAAAYSALVIVSTIRYAPDFIKALSDGSKTMQSGFLRAVVIGGMATVAAPVTFTYEVYQNLAKPFVLKAWEIAKDVVRAVKDAAVWAYDNIVVPVARAIRDFAKAAWQAVKDFAKAAWEFAKDAARFVRDLIVDFAKAVKQLAISFYNNVLVPLGRAIKQLAQDFVRIVKDVAKFVKDVVVDIARAIKDLAVAFYENVMTPVGHAIRGLSAGAVAGIVAAFIVAGPFLAAVGINFIVKPAHGIFNKIASWPIAFRIAAAVVATPLIAAAAMVSYKAAAALVGLTVTGSMAVGLGGGFLEGVKEGYANGFVAGIKKGVGDAAKLATGSLQTAKTNYSNWRANLK